MSTNAERAGLIVKRRREELDLNQLEVQADGGPSNSKLTEIENGRMDKLTPNMAKKLDRGLRWQKGSARSVWMGGEPIPLEQELPDVSAFLMLLEHADEPTRRRILDMLSAGSAAPPSVDDKPANTG